MSIIWYWPKDGDAEKVIVGLTRGYGRSVSGGGGNRPNRFCECAIVGLRTSLFYVVMRDVNMTAIDKTHDTVWPNANILFLSYFHHNK